MITGTVLSYNDQKGCGFIRPDNFEEDYSSTPPR
jgi:cold shock CspA family protein